MRHYDGKNPNVVTGKKTDEKKQVERKPRKAVKSTKAIREARKAKQSEYKEKLDKNVHKALETLAEETLNNLPEVIKTQINAKADPLGEVYKSFYRALFAIGKEAKE